MILVKKYPNRRLYDTQASRYITLDELQAVIRRGQDVLVQDASTGVDLTQETLTQIILERGNGRILPSTLLMRLIRLDDEALGEFRTRYVGWALEVYVNAKDRAKSFLPMNPLATAPFAATDAIARMMLGASQWGAQRNEPAPMPPGPPPIEEPIVAPPPPPPSETELERIRRELDELKRSVVAHNAPKKPAKKKRTTKR